MVKQITKCSNGNSVKFILRNTINVLYKTQNCQNINLLQFDKILINNILKLFYLSGVSDTITFPE